MAEKIKSKIPRGPGRPRDDSRDAAILEAVIDVLAEVGYDRLTVDSVAARARAGKGALYRRWPSKEELVADAVGSWKDEVEVPDTGSLVGDLQALMDSDVAPIDPRRSPIVCGLMSAAARDESLASRMRERFVAPRQQLLLKIIRKAVERGEVPAERNAELVSQVIPAFLFTRTVLYGDLVTPELLREVITQVVYPLLAAPATVRWPEG